MGGVVQSRRASVTLFLVLVLALSIPFWVLDAVSPVELLPRLPISAFGVFTPSIAALILTYRNDHLSGALQLLRRSFDLKRVENGGWFLVAILANPAIAVFAYGVMRAVGEFVPKPSPPTLAVLPFFVLFFIAALGEEIGWSGYATEPLQRRWGTLGAGILLGLVWALWHVVPLVQVDRSAEWIAWWSLGTISLRAIMSWLYIHSGKSVFAAALFHAMINLCWQLFPNNGSFYDPRVFALITVCLAGGIFATERILTRGGTHAA